MNFSFEENDIIKTYKYLHSIPEPGFQEFKTSEYILEFLTELGLKPVRCAKTGVYADIKGTKTSDKLFLIRADIDALPLDEESGVDFASSNKGYMHACGHDMHTACLLYAAKALCENCNWFSGTVRVLFQPAEEGTGGALPMISEGAAEGVTASIAMHVDPLEALGTLIYRDGSITASPDDFKVNIKGKGGHGAEPENCINPLVAAAEIIKVYSEIKNKYFSDKDCVVSVCTINGGSFNNIIPDNVEITGTARAFEADVRFSLRDKLKELAFETGNKFGVDIEFEYNELYPPTVNSPVINSVVVKASEKITEITNIKSLDRGSMTGDDFAYFAEICPSSYFRFGVGGSGVRYPLHSSKFKIDTSALMPACKLLVYSSIEYLNN